MVRSKDIGSNSDKCRIRSGSGSINVSVTGREFFLQGANTVMKINGNIAGDSATGRKYFTARQWAALIGFCKVETWKQIQKIESKSNVTENIWKCRFTYGPMARMEKPERGISIMVFICWNAKGI